MHESILAFRQRRYLWAALALAAASIAIYLWHDPEEPPNGGTALGYTLGTLGAFMILWLAWFGVRKRRYASTLGTVQGWLSAHVYLGLALLVVVLLHAGFQVGANVHTLALVLLVLVIASGIWGVYAYSRYPARQSENRGGAGRAALLEELRDIDRVSRRIAAGLPQPYADVTASAVHRTELGTTLWQRLRRRDGSQVVLPEKGSERVVSNAGQEALLDWLAGQQSTAADPETGAKIGELSALVRNKRRLLKKLADDLAMQAALEIWLYAHVPLTAALLAALAVHVITVFLYW